MNRRGSRKLRKLSPGEILSLNKLLQMEAQGLSIARAGMAAITDEQLNTLTQSGITATEARIMGLQQFIAENHVTPTGEVQ